MSAEAASSWTRAVPEHWEVGRVSHLASSAVSNVDKHTVEGETPVLLCNYTDVYKNDKITQSMVFMEATATADQIRRFRLRRGDVVITKDSETSDDIGIPAYVDYAASDLVCGYHLAVLRPYGQACVPRFLHWLMGSRPVLEQWLHRASGVTRVGLRSSDIGRAVVPVPPLDEQRAIADYLDDQTAKIDALIAKQEQMIELLEERRRAGVYAWVTGASGSHDGPTRPGPLGATVPDHWRVGPLRHFATYFSGWTPDTTDGSAYEGGNLWANISDIRGGVLDGTAKRLSDEACLGRKCARPGDLLFSFKLSVGAVALVGSPMYTNEAIAVFTETEHFLPRFGYYSMPVYVPENAEPNIYGARLLNASRIALAPVAMPPKSEQRTIADHLDRETAKVDALIAKTREHIELAKERRSALITAAVTGQIDVRTATREVV